MKLKAILVAAVVALVTACASTDSSNSDNVKQTEIWQRYWVSYEEGPGQFEAGCTFRFGGSTGTTLILNGNSNVKLNGEVMPHSTGELIKGVIGGTHYKVEKNSLVKECVFEYTDNEGKVYTNKVNLSPVLVKDVPETLDFAADNKIEFDELKIDKTEGISIEIKNPNTTYVIIENPVIEGNTVIVKGAELKDLGNGEVEITFTRRKETDLQQGGHLGGSISADYTTKAFKSKVINCPKPVAENTEQIKSDTSK